MVKEKDIYDSIMNLAWHKSTYHWHIWRVNSHDFSLLWECIEGCALLLSDSVLQPYLLCLSPWAWMNSAGTCTATYV